MGHIFPAFTIIYKEATYDHREPPHKAAEPPHDSAEPPYDSVEPLYIHPCILSILVNRTFHPTPLAPLTPESILFREVFT